MKRWIFFPLFEVCAFKGYCPPSCLCHSCIQQILSSSNMVGSGFSLEWECAVEQESIPATEELLKLRLIKKQTLSVPFSLLSLTLKLLFCHYLKLSIKFLIAQGIDFGKKLGKTCWWDTTVSWWHQSEVKDKCIFAEEGRGQYLIGRRAGQVIRGAQHNWLLAQPGLGDALKQTIVREKDQFMTPAGGSFNAECYLLL